MALLEEAALKRYGESDGNARRPALKKMLNPAKVLMD
jgi:hypothetical protein